MFDQAGQDDKVAVRTENINTSKKISAIRGEDTSGQNGTAVVVALSDRYVQIVFASAGIGKGFNFKVDIYTNEK